MRGFDEARDYEKVTSLFEELLNLIEGRRIQAGKKILTLFRELNPENYTRAQREAKQYWHYVSGEYNPVDAKLMHKLSIYFNIEIDRELDKEKQLLFNMALREGQKWVRKLFKYRDNILPLRVCDEIFQRLKHEPSEQLVKIAEETGIRHNLLVLWKNKRIRRITHPRYAKLILLYYDLWDELTAKQQQRIDKRIEEIGDFYYHRISSIGRYEAKLLEKNNAREKKIIKKEEV